MRQCIAEEFYNAMGLDEGVDVGNIFDYEFSHKPTDTSLSAFDLLLLKILYSDALHPGISRANTEATVKELVSGECGIDR